MKHVLIMLLLAAYGTLLSAQTTHYYFSNTQSVYKDLRLMSGKASFQFWYAKNNRIILEMTDVRQLNVIPNLDSLVQEAFQSIKPLKDSFKNDGLTRRVDYIVSNDIPPQIRITTHPAKFESFSYYKDQLVRTKIEKDTLRIVAVTPRPAVNKLPSSGLFQHYFTILLLVDNFDDLATFPTNAIEDCVNKVKPDLGDNLTKKGKLNSRFSAYYNMQTGKMFSPSKPKYIGYGKSSSFVPTIHFGVQYGRGTFIPSAAAGMQYSIEDGSYATKYFRAYWEPYFSFSRDAGNKVTTQRNDFITVRYSVFFKDRELNKINTVSNISVGYLAGRRGNLFEPNTFKVGVPGFLAGSLLFEPEFFFNDFFRNFSPSLKMTLLFE
jgi:hypothetical protein